MSSVDCVCRRAGTDLSSTTMRERWRRARDAVGCAAPRASRTRGEEVKDFVEINFEASPAQDRGGDCFLRESRERLMVQMRASNS